MDPKRRLDNPMLQQKMKPRHLVRFSASFRPPTPQPTAGAVSPFLDPIYSQASYRYRRPPRHQPSRQYPTATDTMFPMFPVANDRRRRLHRHGPLHR